ncbi:MAG: GtrA family protein [Clostridiales bacterium]|nr:GtrA family protein [Clostridiales bacterium]
MNERQDIFDRIMSWEMMRSLQPFYKRFKEQLLYLLFGGLTTLLSIGLFWLFTDPFAMNALWANVICWVICVAFAYVTNRTWVFKDKAHGVRGVIRECIAFFVGRLGTLILEELVLWLGISLLSIDSLIVKIIAQVLVIIGNYVISKWFVFKEKR